MRPLRSCFHSTAQRCWWAVSRIWNFVTQWTPQHFKPLTLRATKLLHHCLHQEPAFSSFHVLLKSIDLLTLSLLGLAGVWGAATHHQFFSNRFVHVLLLRLAFTFPLASRHLSPSSSLSGLERQCQVWQNGISWKSVSGVSTVVEIIDRNRWVIVLVSKKSREAAVICSSVIRMILDLQQQLCRVLTLSECLISPSLLDRYPFDVLPETDLFDLPAVARSMLCHDELVLDQKEGKFELRTDEALSCEPYYLLQPSSVCQLFKESMASQPVPDPLLLEIQTLCLQSQQKPQDHKELSEYVNKHSIFAGRNPLVSSVAACRVCDCFLIVYRRWLG